MESLAQHNERKTGISKALIISIIVAILLVAGVITLLSLRPSKTTIEQTALEGVYREGSPEFATLTKRIVIKPDLNRTMESPTGLGDIMMSIPAQITNRTDQTLTTLEVKVGVVNTKGEVIKEKTMLVVPKQQKELPPGESINTIGVVEGFSATDDRANVQWKVTGIKTKQMEN